MTITHEKFGGKAIKGSDFRAAMVLNYEKKYAC